MTIKELTDKINSARDAYYNKHEHNLSDDQFDALIEQLKKLDPTNPAITSVGFVEKPSAWKKVSAEYGQRMGSLDKVNNPKDMNDWFTNLKVNDKLFVTQKLDGISIGLTYRAGKLVSAQTRSSGEANGDEILANVQIMQGVKRTLSSAVDVFVRSEIVMLRSVFAKHFSDRSNCRNLASGFSKAISGDDAKHLTVISYQVVSDDLDLKTEKEQFEWLSKEGFNTPDYWLFDSTDKLNEFWRDYQDTKRSSLPYDIDGLVVGLNDLDLQKSFGELHSRPRGKLAYKFETLRKKLKF